MYLHVPPRPYTALLNGDETYEKTMACGWHFGSRKVSHCYVILCSEICKAGNRRFVRTSFNSPYRRRVKSEGLILFRKVGTPITNYMVSLPRRHQSWTLLSLLHVPLSSDNLLPNSSDGVYPAVSILLFLPHTHTHTHTLSLSVSLYFHIPLQSAPYEYAYRRRAASPLSEHLRRSQPRIAAHYSSLSSLTFGYKTFPNASFEALGSGRYFASLR